ncbi:heme-binding domain-containing protein [Flavobacterium frigidarium]|uniref:Heme-binding domain-containing protein n=1 Tax=Flavobacterium frigidarium TaxID=99286 RepID=A0ABV4KER5_9FLAO
MKILKIILLILLIVFVGIQFIPTKRNQNDVVPNTDFMLVNKVPKDIKNNLQVSCYDCHSSNTQYPWYSKIQPGAWFMENHIKDGKTELNFSEWDSLSNRRKKSKLKSIISQIEDNKMPLSSYTLIHRNAIFSEAEKQRITTYLKKLKSNL